MHDHIPHCAINLWECNAKVRPKHAVVNVGILREDSTEDCRWQFARRHRILDLGLNRLMTVHKA